MKFIGNLEKYNALFEHENMVFKDEFMTLSGSEDWRIINFNNRNF